MRIAVDTNVLLRVLVEDDPKQAVVAQATLDRATRIVVSIPVLCELVWTLRRIYKLPDQQIVMIVSALGDDPRVEADWTLYEAGLGMLRNGGDFADGAIAEGGRHAGADTFVTFDTDAARRLKAQGVPVTLLG